MCKQHFPSFFLLATAMTQLVNRVCVGVQGSGLVSPSSAGSLHTCQGAHYLQHSLKYRQMSRRGVRYGVSLTELSANGMISLKLRQGFFLEFSSAKKEERKRVKETSPLTPCSSGPTVSTCSREQLIKQTSSLHQKIMQHCISQADKLGSDHPSPSQG